MLQLVVPACDGFVLDLEMQLHPSPRAFKISVPPAELLQDGSLQPVQSPSSIVRAFAVGEKEPLPSGLAPAWTSSRSSKEVLTPDDVVRTPQPPMGMPCVSAANYICSIDDDDDFALLTPLAARCSSGDRLHHEQDAVKAREKGKFVLIYVDDDCDEE
ncbi:hypothetical protein ZWY2020_055551 [Hordeum vulgare]|nr:hypothetical protein ZWY2020_055551 [Hordeum vulgare]